jgi:DNA-binding NtrC family response regulator
MAERVLLVDDEEDFLETLAERMRGQGMDVTTATTARQALEQTDKDVFDAIILDLQMPGMDGIEALKEFKKKNPDLQIILLTGHATVEKGVKAMKLGATDLLEKPTDFETLVAKIKEAQAQRMLLVEKKAEKRVRDIVERRGW